MEIKPRVRHIFIFQRLKNIAELIAKSFLRTFFVDQIYEVLLLKLGTRVS